MNHILIFIYFHGFYFDIIGYIKYQLLIRFNPNLLCFQIEIQYYVSSIIHLLEFESALFPVFDLSRQVFYLSKDNGLFPPLTHLTIVFFIKLTNLPSAHECDHSFGSLLPLAIKYQAFVFSPFGGWRGGSGTLGGLPEQEYQMDRHS